MPAVGTHIVCRAGDTGEISLSRAAIAIFCIVRGM
jgi:hypothetical protein